MFYVTQQYKLKGTSQIKIGAINNMDIFRYVRKPQRRTQRRAHEECIVCTVVCKKAPVGLK